MRKLLVSLVLLAVAAATVDADPQVLAGGALIVHSIQTPPRYGPPCETYFQYGSISECDEQNNTIQPSPTETVVWFVVAAFEEDKEFCGVQFGFNDYDPASFYFADAGPCFPPTGGLTIPSAGWPGPNEGTAFVVIGDPWTGNFLPVYWFVGYAYDYGSDLIQLVPDPTVAEPFGGIGNCASPPEKWDAALGGLGINQPGTWVCWGWENSVCCVGDDCIVVRSELECTDLSGEFHPEWDSCDPLNPCLGAPAVPTDWGSIKALYR